MRAQRKKHIGRNRRLLALVLSAAMVLSLMPLSAGPEKTRAAGEVTFTALEGTPGAADNENYGMLVDGNTSNKWCVTEFTDQNQDDTSGGAYIIWQASREIQVAGYKITTGNDTAGEPGRNPKAWKLYGAAKKLGRTDDGWTLLHSVAGDDKLPAKNNQSVEYQIPSSEIQEAKYSYFKLEIAEIQSGSVMQMAEFELQYVICQEHSWKETGCVEPSCTEDGYIIYTCSVCGTEKQEPDKTALGHNYIAGRCTRCGAAEMQKPGGDGTQEEPYQIGTVGELYWFAGLVNGDPEVCQDGMTQNTAACAKLTADITVNRNVLEEDGSLSEQTEGFLTWPGIGNTDDGYKGTFDGEGHVIRGLYMRDGQESAGGLVGRLVSGGTVSGVGVEDSYMCGTAYAGGICGNIVGGEVCNCYFSGCVTSSAKDKSGTVYGSSYNGTVQSCYSLVKKTADIENSGLGNDSGENTITRCYYGYLGGEDREKVSTQNYYKSQQAFQSGEVAYLLQNGQTDSLWGQDLSRENTRPGFDSGHRVYATSGCMTYSNDSQKTGEKAHGTPDANGMCPDCGKIWADISSGVRYLDEAGKEKTVEKDKINVITEETTSLDGKGENQAWYVVNSTTVIRKRLQVSNTVNLILMDGTTLSALEGIQVGEGASLTIYAQSAGKEKGKLFATGGENEAGIGESKRGTVGSITINGGEITARGGKSGAGIGGGYYSGAGSITINGGEITAQGGEYGAGIGGGNRGSGGTIRIDRGEVTATGGNDGAGIGGGYNGSGGTITINGGEVTAQGGGNGSGIGGGIQRSGGTVTINGGEITAAGGNFGAGIGGGQNASGGDIRINGGEVTAQGGSNFGAGIGGGYEADGGKIVISGGKVTAAGGWSGAGIGGGDSGVGGDITISGGEVNAQGGYRGAGIGGGDEGAGGTVTISGGEVSAAGGSDGAGIGGGYKGSGGDITISGGKVTAAGGWNGAGIGGGRNGAAGTFATQKSGEKAGTAAIFASSISDTSGAQSDTENPWSGLIGYEKTNGSKIAVKIYGEDGQFTLTQDITVPEGYSVIIESGKTLTIPQDRKLYVKDGLSVEGNLDGDGTLILGKDLDDDSGNDKISTTINQATCLDGSALVITAKNRVYNGTRQVEIAKVTINPEWEQGKDVEVESFDLTGTVSDAGAGTDKKVSLQGEIKLKGNDAGKYYVDVPKLETTVTINKETYTPPEITRSVTCSKEHEVSIDLSSYQPNGSVSFGEVKTGGDIKYTESGQPQVSNGKLTFTTAAGNEGDRGTITIPTTADNYESYNIVVNVSLKAPYEVRLKDGFTVTAAVDPEGVAAGTKISALTLKEAPFTDVSGNMIPGTLSWKDPEQKITAAKTRATWKFVPKNVEYATVEGTVTVDIKLKLSFEKYSITLGDEIGVNFYMSIPEEALTEEAYMEFSVSGKDGGITQMKPAGIEPDADGQYKFTCEVNALQMADTITAVYHYGEDKALINTYSVRKYIETIVNSDGQPDTVKELAMAIADYGYYAQLCLSETKGWKLGEESEKPDHVQMIHYTEKEDLNVEAADLEDYAYQQEGTISGITEISRSLTLDAKTAVNLYFTKDESLTKELSFEVTNESGQLVDPQVKMVDQGKCYRVTIPGIAAHKLGETYTVKVNETMTIRMSALSYAHAVLQSDKTTDTTKQTVKALYHYYQKTQAYKNK